MTAARGGAAARGRRRGGGHEEEAENGERWMVTYADMLTLLLVLFIVLYAISSVNTSKFTELKTSLASAFGNGQPSVLASGTGALDGAVVSDQTQNVPSVPIPTVGSNTSSSVSDTAAAQREVDQFSKIKAAIKASLHAKGLDGNAQFAIDERGLVVTVVTDQLVFSGNSAVLESEGAVIMNAVLPPLLKIDNQIQVDGHTNQQNVSTAPYPSGWELSSARASAVVRYLVQHGGMSPSRLSAAGYSDQRPLLPASDPRSITRNRRVDIVVLSKLPATARAALPALGAATGGG